MVIDVETHLLGGGCAEAGGQTQPQCTKICRKYAPNALNTTVTQCQGLTAVPLALIGLFGVGWRTDYSMFPMIPYRTSTS